MILSVSFRNVDHPLIIIAQIISTFFLFQLFFAIRRTSPPLPQIVAGLAFGMLANLVGRTWHKDWFWIADAVQYVTLAAVIIAAVRAARKAKKEAAQRPGAPVVVADIFDRVEVRVTWAVGLVLAGGLTYYCINLYTDVQHRDAELVAVAKKAEAEAAERYAEQLCKTEQNQTTLLTAVTSISATQSTIIANQYKNSAAILEGQKGVKQLVSKQTQAVKKTIQNSVIDARPLEPKKTEPEPEEKKNLWKRFKGMFHTSVDAQVTPYDTLVYQ